MNFLITFVIPKTIVFVLIPLILVLVLFAGIGNSGVCQKNAKIITRFLDDFGVTNYILAPSWAGSGEYQGAPVGSSLPLEHQKNVDHLVAKTWFGDLLALDTVLATVIKQMEKSTTTMVLMAFSKIK